ncbi:hypothetical protein [Haloplanus salilacus]|uniref:hypothetical protein n=1 Tax=Haloplanus salilacus TaxID=2949994 RepID=UPI0030D27C41
MRTDRIVPVVVALAGFAAIVVGVHQGLVHVAPGYEGTVTTGWDGDPNHEERLLAWTAAVAVCGTVAALRWRRLALVPVLMGGVVLFYVFRAVLNYAQDPGLYTVVDLGGESLRFVLGAEPFLLVGGAILLVAAGVRVWTRASRTRRG